MPDLGEFVECNNCGMVHRWQTRSDGAILIKVLPTGWRLIQETTAGDVQFCSQTCEKVWKSGREWELPYLRHEIEVNPEGMTPTGISVTDGLFCECGVGPFKNNRGMAGHRNSRIHKRRMGMDVATMEKPARPRHWTKRAKRKPRGTAA